MRKYNDYVLSFQKREYAYLSSSILPMQDVSALKTRAKIRNVKDAEAALQQFEDFGIKGDV